jgi:hypothetical protein
MKVKELIKKLKKHDPEMNVKLTNTMYDNDVDVKVSGLSHSDIVSLWNTEDELWLVEENGTKWLENLPNKED